MFEDTIKFQVRLVQSNSWRTKLTFPPTDKKHWNKKIQQGAEIQSQIILSEVSRRSWYKIWRVEELKAKVENLKSIMRRTKRIHKYYQNYLSEV